MIALEDVHKAFGPVRALGGLSLRVPDGAITGLLGPNGAGKTTALRIACGVMAPDRGRAAVDGRDLARDRLGAQRRLGVLPHAHGLSGRQTPREHLRFSGALHGLAGDDLEARVEAVVARLGLGPFADRRVEGFSQGQRLRVALARALVHDPPNLVLDEPTNGLDVAAVRALRATLRELRDEGRCVLLSSHVLHEVALLCQRVAVVAAGRVVAEGTPEELQARTGQATLEDAFVALIGSAEGLG